MRLVSTLALLCMAVPARAEPVTSPRACAVTVARAPDDVRIVIERWVAAETHCSLALEVRVVPTEGGLYLLATDEHGGVRERLVPNAETAGVLVASWVADDNEARGVSPAPAATDVSQTPTQESLTPPGVAAIVTPPMPVPARPNRTKWFGLGALGQLTESSGSGVRGELDVWMRGSISVGAAASLSGARLALLGGGLLSGDLQSRDARVMAYAAHTSLLGRWHLRPALGVGVGYMQGLVTLHDSGSSTTDYFQVDTVAPTLEVSVLIAREFGRSWAGYVGPVATLVAQEFEIQMSSASSPMTVMRSALDFVLFAGVRHRL